ncbi:hypothetical protein [Carboxylicivirga linearis]|uniref:DNA-binding protein n=1 Tax=Carboxylicivirga linearis TaxID=1628157 RepID=A0ABS5JXF0_9BACT|nr:hypothetical protein [Carboxylicivirga linearis]MBS2099129.1 hypothetical protein [Carboxylicivirga linearis]
MKDNFKTGNYQKQSMVFLPAQDYEFIKNSVIELRSMLEDGNSKSSTCLDEYISEKDAKIEFNRKTTWFWNQRNNGKLSYKKLGSTVYYLKQDLLNLLSDK